MPYINIQIGTQLTQSQKNQLQQQTTRLMHSHLGKRREVTIVHITESTSGNWSCNATSISRSEPVPAYVDIKITEHTNTPEQKAEMISSMMILLKQETGVMQEASYVVIDEVPANSWGYNGLTQRARQTARQKKATV